MNRHEKQNTNARSHVFVSPAKRKQDWLPSGLVWIVFVVSATRLFGWISRYAVNMFFSDQWDFNDATLFEKHSLWEMFRWQHGPHRQGMGALISYFVEPHFRWNSRTESFCIGGLIVIAAACAMWLKKRITGTLTYFDVCIPLIFFTPLQFGQIFVVANWAHGPLPLFLIILYCLAWTIPRVSWRYGLVLAINFVTIYTGFGLFIGMITPLALAADYHVSIRKMYRGQLLFLGSLLLSLGSFASFFAHYVYTPAVGCEPNMFQSPGIYGRFVTLMFANVLGAKGLAAFPSVIGAMLLASLLAALAINCKRLQPVMEAMEYRYLIPAILIAYSLVFSAIAAYGRSCVGLPEAQVSRYVMYMELGLLGLYLSLSTIRRNILRLTLLVTLTMTVAGTAIVRRDDRIAMGYYRDLKKDWRACYLAYTDIATCDRLTGHWIYGEAEGNALKEKLEYLKQTKQNLYADAK